MNNITHGNINLVENNSHTKITQNGYVLQRGALPPNHRACGELSTPCRLPFIHGALPLRPRREGFPPGPTLAGAAAPRPCFFILGIKFRPAAQCSATNPATVSTL